MNMSTGIMRRMLNAEYCKHGHFRDAKCLRNWPLHIFTLSKFHAYRLVISKT